MRKDIILFSHKSNWINQDKMPKFCLRNMQHLKVLHGYSYWSCMVRTTILLSLETDGGWRHHSNKKEMLKCFHLGFHNTVQCNCTQMVKPLWTTYYQEWKESMTQLLSFASSWNVQDLVHRLHNTQDNSKALLSCFHLHHHGMFRIWFTDSTIHRTTAKHCSVASICIIMECSGFGSQTPQYTGPQQSTAQLLSFAWSHKLKEFFPQTLKLKPLCITLQECTTCTCVAAQMNGTVFIYSF